MPNRIIRAELLESESWLALKDNGDRNCWLACFLTVDNFGNMPAGPFRLIRLWRPYGIDGAEKVAQTLTALADQDLIRTYTADGKPYLHIPRFGQDLRYVGTLWPLSPWTTKEQKQLLAKKSTAHHMRPPVDVEVDVDVDVQAKGTSAPKPVDNFPGSGFVKHWLAKAEAVGMKANAGEDAYPFALRVQKRYKEKTK